jgi:hypothetical protein
MEIRTPSQTTLDKYGLSLGEWLAIWEHQGKKCPICNKVPKTGSPTEFNIDHRHTPRWKKLLPSQRKTYVRGILCQWCNRSFMAKGMTIEKAKNIVKYLEVNQ